MRTSKRIFFSSWQKLITEFFWKVPCSMFISLISLARLSILSTHRREIEGFLMQVNVLVSMLELHNYKRNLQILKVFHI